MTDPLSKPQNSKSQTLKVLHVIPSVAPCRGGPSKAIIEMVYALRQIGVDAEIATTNDNGAELLDVELNRLTEYQGVPIRFFKRFSPPINFLREFAYSYGFTRWLNAHIADYDLIHVHAIFSYCSTRTMAIARKHNVPYVVRPIGQLESWSLEQSKGRKKQYLDLIERKNLNAAAMVHFTAESEKEQALELLPNLTSTVTPLGIDLPMLVRDSHTKMIERWQLNDHCTTLVYLSRIHPKKGLDILLKALASLDDIEFQLVIAGTGNKDHIQELKQLSEQLGIDQHCHFIGFVQGLEKNTLLQGADLFTLTSHSENFGIAVLEALASGTPALISQEVALSEQVSQEQLGYVTELNIEAVKDTLSSALNNTEQLKQTGNKARRFIEQNYQWPVISKQLLAVYKHIKSNNNV